MSKIVIAFLVVVIVAVFAIILTSINNTHTGAFGVDDSLVVNPIFLIGSLTLDSDFLAFLQEDKSLLFGPTGQCFPKDFAVRDDFFEVNGILDCNSQTCPGACEIVTTLQAEVLANPATTEKERNIVLKILGQTSSDRNLEEELDCLLDIYSQQSLTVGSDTYFNKVKNCYVRAIKDLGILEQTYIDEPEAFFFVQKFQAIEVDLQHMLAIEDEKAKLAPITVQPSPTPQPNGCADLGIYTQPFCASPFNNCACEFLFNGNCAIDCTAGTPAPCGSPPGDPPVGGVCANDPICKPFFCVEHAEGCCKQPACHVDVNCTSGCCETPCTSNADCPGVGNSCNFGFCTQAVIGGVNCCIT